jgi:hypothetical protein
MNDVQVHDSQPLRPVLRRLARKLIVRAEEAIDEIPATVRRIRNLLLVVTVSVAVLAVAAVAFLLHRVV